MAEMTCTCTPCSECDGHGIVFYSMTGDYLGKHRCDDLDEHDTCPECHGLGLDYICEYCVELEEEEDEEWPK